MAPSGGAEQDAPPTDCVGARPGGSTYTGEAVDDFAKGWWAVPTLQE
ncbi:MAG: hypothetical protein OXI86_17775 [Candidatus Poribacteria bacterium]|nr:hypothetical protein [Candidatus Poribacteria bacterium]